MPDDFPDLDPNAATIPLAAPVPTASAKQTPDLPLPEELTLLLPHGNYSVEGFLGQGGMGAVYKGTQVRLQRQVAIKIMRRDQGKDHGFEERFRREALALAQLNHPNIVNVIDYGEAGPDYLYIVMEFVDGTDLVGVIRSGEMMQETALKLLPQICDALQFAHDNGIVHRDIKPANILLTRDGRIKMADFGLAKRFDVNSTFQTQTGAGMGTPDYAAPEQFDPNGNVDHRADIYALGVMIYQMVTGQLPRGAWKPPSEKADVDAHWDKIVSHALQTDPSDRYASVSEIKTDISSITAVPGGQVGMTGSAISRKSGFNGTLGGSTTALNQAGGRSVSQTRTLVTQGEVQLAKSSRSRVPVLMVAALVVLVTGSWFGWRNFKLTKVDSMTLTSEASSYPRPKAWVDATQELRELVLKNNAGKINGEWLHTIKPSGYSLGGSRLFRDVAMRVTLKGAATILLRRRDNTESVQNYSGELTPAGHALLYQWDAKRFQKIGFKELSTSLDSYEPQAEHELMVVVRGDEISLWLDGRLMLIQQDNALDEGHIALNWFNSSPDPARATRIKKVEYADLGGSPPVAMSESVASRTWSPPTPIVTASSEWTNLIPHINPQRDAIRGGWAVDQNGLTSAQRAPWALCNIPVQDPGGDYDLRYRVTRGEGRDIAMFFLFRKGSTGGYVPIDFTNTALPEFADGQRWAMLEDIVDQDFLASDAVKAKRKVWFPRGREVTVLLQVREKEVTVSVDGEEAFRWPAQWSRLQQRNGAGSGLFVDVTGDPIFGVGIFDCEAVFRSIEMRRVPAGDTATPTAPLGEPGSIPHLLTSPDYEWTAPVNLGPLVNSPTLEDGAWISPDGLYLMFGSKREGDGELFESRRTSVDVPWGKPTPVFSSVQPGLDEHPWLSEDGLRLYYHSTAGPGHITSAVPTGDIYSRERATVDQAWSPPVNLGPNVNQGGWESTPRLSKDELTLLFTTSPRSGGQGVWDIWRCRRKSRQDAFGPPENLGPGVNTSEAEYHAMIATDDRTILFLRGIPNLTSSRLFMATPDAKGQYQTTALDFPITGKLSNPWLSADGRALWFAWDGPGSLGGMDLWEIRRVPKAKKNPPAPSKTSASSAAATKDTPFENTLGMKFVPVPITGGPTDKRRVLFSVWETRVQDYEAFVKETKRTWAKPGFVQEPVHPAVMVSIEEARLFCSWLTERERRAGKLGPHETYRLPTDHEWSCAVGIGDKESATMTPREKNNKLSDLFPWGSTWPPPANSGNFWSEELRPLLTTKTFLLVRSELSGYLDGHATTAPVGSYMANALGLHDLGGNVWEWCADWMDGEQKEWVMRGASWAYNGRGVMLLSDALPVHRVLSLTATASAVCSCRAKGIDADKEGATFWRRLG